MITGFGIDVDGGVDEILENEGQKAHSNEVFKASAGKKVNRAAVLGAIDPAVSTRLSATSNKGRVGAKEKLWGKQAQINWKTFQAQKQCVEDLVAETGLKKADIFNAALALVMNYHESGSDLLDIELKFTKEPKE